jgi:hypothetical protein
MPNWNRLTWCASAIAAIALYFLTALWLKYSYVKTPRPAGAVFSLSRPFFEIQGSEVAFAVKVPSLDELSDSPGAPRRSPFMLYENTVPLGPAHTEHTEILRYGQGRFSHWNDAGFIFSSSDGTNPKFNGRTYWVVIPSSAAD